MSEDKTKNGQDSAHSVSSSTPRTVTFKVPNVPKPNMDRFRGNPRPHFALVAILFILISVLGGFVGAKLENRNSLNSGTLSGQKKIVTSESQLISKIAKTVGPSVVSVNVNITSTTS